MAGMSIHFSTNSIFFLFELGIVSKKVIRLRGLNHSSSLSLMS